MSDNYIRQVYRRNKNNPPWCGQYFIVISNKSFEEWAEECNIQKYTYKNYTKEITEEFKAFKKRFFVAHIEEYQDEHTCARFVKTDSLSTRGTPEEQIIRNKMYTSFIEEINASLTDFLSYSYENEDIEEELEKEKNKILNMGPTSFV